MKLFYTLLLSTLVSLPALAQKTLPYVVDFDTKEQQDEWTQYRMGSDKYYDWTFATSENAFVSHDYPVGAGETDTTKDWLVSPAIDLSNGAEIALSISGYTIFELTDDDYFGIWVSTGSADPADGDFVEVSNLTDFSLANEYKDTSGLDVKSKALDGYIALVYEATNNWFTIAVDDIEIKASTTSIDQPRNTLNASLWYGSNGAQLSIKANESVQYSITNLSGQQMAEGTLSSDVSIERLVALNPGMYVVSLASPKGSFTSKFLAR